jgi:hypothetical protein
MKIELVSKKVNDYKLKEYDINPAISNLDVLKLFCAYDFIRAKTQKETLFTTYTRFILVEEVKSENKQIIEHEDFNFEIKKNNDITYRVKILEERLSEMTFKEIFELNLPLIDRQYLALKKNKRGFINEISEISLSGFFDVNNNLWDTFFEEKYDVNKKSYILRELITNIKKYYEVIEDEKNKENNIYKKIRLINDAMNESKNLNIFKFDTHLNLKFSLSSSSDIYEIFNNFQPSNEIPFFHAKDFNKTINNLIINEDWIKELVDEDIYFYVRISDYNDMFAKCIFSDIRYVDKTYYFDLNVLIEKSYFESQNQRFDLFLKIVKYMPDFIVSTDIPYNENIYKGYMYLSLNNFEYIDIPLLQHYFMLDDAISFIMSIDERSSIFKVRGGLSSYIHLYKKSKTLKEKYDFDGKLNWIYDKIGKLSKTKLNLINVQERGENEFDVLIIKYKKLKIENLESIMKGILSYISNEKNIETIKKLYNSLL